MTTFTPAATSKAPRINKTYIPPFSDVWRRIGDVARRSSAFLRTFFGIDESFAFIGERRGYMRGLCENGCDDVHDVHQPCPRQLVGDCSACGQVVTLDSFGNCPTRRRTHLVSNRRPKFRFSEASPSGSSSAPSVQIPGKHGDSGRVAEVSMRK